jgi:hypothetical protein
MTIARWLLVSLIACLLAAPAFAQPPMPKPGPEHEILKKLEGTWEATVQMGGQESKGTMTYKIGPGGMWMIGDFQGEFGGGKFEGHGLDGFDSNKKKYVSAWIDSMSQSPMLMDGSYDAEKKTMTMTGEGPGPDGKPVKYKSVTEYKDDDNLVFKMYQEGSDQPMMTINYKRKK